MNATSLVALGVGVPEAMAVRDALAWLQKGIGDTLGSLVLILGFGAMLGNLLTGLAWAVVEAIHASPVHSLLRHNLPRS